MQSSNQPDKISLPFANSGAKQTIPVASQIGIEDARASYTDGFPPLTRIPLSAGGKPPFGTDMNGILNAITDIQQWQSAGGSFKYDAAFASSIGGYPKGAILIRSDQSGLWLNGTEDNATDPDSGGAGWQPIDAGITAITMTNANVTLTSAQAAKPIVVITGTLTGNLQLILPTYPKPWIIVNGCTGAFTITAKTAAGTGVAIAAGTTQHVYGDGTNVSSAGGINKIVRQVFNASGTYTPSPGMLYCDVELVGGGGGGGGAVGGSGNSSAGGGGGGGGYAKKTFTSLQIGASKAITIGAAGVAGPAGSNTGGLGGTTSLAALLTATGGSGGLGGSSTALVSLSGMGGDSGSGTLGDYIIRGSVGGVGLTMGGSNGAISGYGGASFFGLQTTPAGPVSSGTNAVGRGSGGAGGASTSGSMAGGSGGPGMAVITEYCI